MFRNLNIKSSVTFAMILMTIIILVVGMAGVLCISQMNKSQQEIIKAAFPRMTSTKSVGDAETERQKGERIFIISRGVLIAAIVLSVILAIAIGMRITRDVGHSLAGLKEEVGKIAKAGVEGKPATRGDPEKVSQEFRDIIKGINYALDASIETTAQHGPAVQKIIEGDLTAEIVIRSEQDIMAIGMNHMIASLNNLRNEIRRIAEASKEGMLSERGKPELLKGAYAQIIHDINDILDALIMPTVEANRILSLMSRGNLRGKFEGVCRGDHERLKEAVNGLHAWLNELAAGVSRIADGDLSAAIPKGSEEDQIHEALSGLRNNIQALAEDASMLAKAVSEGNYAARADAAKHHGEFRNMISNVDKIIDAVIEPVKTAAEYRERIAKGEISEKMPEIQKDTATNLFLEMVAKNRPYL